MVGPGGMLMSNVSTRRSSAESYMRIFPELPTRGTSLNVSLSCTSGFTIVARSGGANDCALADCSTYSSINASSAGVALSTRFSVYVFRYAVWKRNALTNRPFPPGHDALLHIKMHQSDNHFFRSRILRCAAPAHACVMLPAVNWSRSNSCSTMSQCRRLKNILGAGKPWTNKRRPKIVCGDRSARRQLRHERRWRGGFERNRYLATS